MAALLLAASANMASAQDSDSLQLDSLTVSVWDVASATVAAVHLRDSVDLKDYYILLCPSTIWIELLGDGGAGPFVKHARSIESDLAAIVLPSRMGTMPSFGVFFKRGKPVGLARIAAEDREGATGRDVARGYLAIPDSTRLADTQRAIFGGKGKVTSDGGIPLIAIQILGAELPKKEGE